MTEPNRSRALIAIVEDEGTVRLGLRRLLSSAGYQVEEYQDGETFLASVSDHLPDCVVLDLHLPGWNGFDVLQHLREKDLQLPVIMVTGCHQPESRTRALAAGAFAFLRKVEDSRALLEAIAAALERSLGVFRWNK